MLLLANHVNFWDPFLLAFGLRVPIRFLAADGNFRTRGMRVLMTAMGAIPKAKARTDMESLRSLQREIANREIVALFPEGQRTWDGRPRPIPPATAKLARILGAPVIVAEIRGGYLSKPRWATYRRRGRIEIHVRTVLHRDELNTLPRPVLNEHIAQALTWNDYHWQRETGVRFSGRRPAEGVEHALYWCPACGAWGMIRSAGTQIHCASCDASWWLTVSGRIREIVGDGKLLPNLGVWGERQEIALRSTLQRYQLGAGGTAASPSASAGPSASASTPSASAGPSTSASSSASAGPSASGSPTAAGTAAATTGTAEATATAAPTTTGTAQEFPPPSLLPYHFSAEYLTGYRSRPLRRRGTVSGTLTERALVLRPGDADATMDVSVPPPSVSVGRTVTAGSTVTAGAAPPVLHKFPLSTIGSIQVQYTRQLEFYASETLHVLRITGPHDSAARIEATVLALQELYKSDKH